MVCGILAFFIPCVGIILAIIAIVLGSGAKKEMQASGNFEGQGQATAGVVLGVIALILGVLGWGILFLAAAADM